MQHNKKNMQSRLLWEGTINSFGLYPVDPMGSYTGRPLDVGDTPVQDADDL